MLATIFGTPRSTRAKKGQEATHHHPHLRLGEPGLQCTASQIWPPVMFCRTALLRLRGRVGCLALSFLRGEQEQRLS